MKKWLLAIVMAVMVCGTAMATQVDLLYRKDYNLSVKGGDVSLTVTNNTGMDYDTAVFCIVMNDGEHVLGTKTLGSRYFYAGRKTTVTGWMNREERAAYKEATKHIVFVTDDSFAVDGIVKDIKEALRNRK